MAKLVWSTSACVLTVAMMGAQCAWADLGPGIGTEGAGNLSTGTTAGSFSDSYVFWVRWTNSPTPTTDQLVDVSLHLDSAGGAFQGINFTTAVLTSYDRTTTFGTTLFEPSGDVTAVFRGVAEGLYRVSYTGTMVPADPDGTLMKAEYSLSVSAASPAPEASDLAMLGMGLAGVMLWARRQKRS